MQSSGLTLDHFHLLTVIGKGSYAKVVLVKKKGTDQVFALKILKKKYIEKKKQ
jgi:serum/glucocorticoid-regulated kinase 2